MDYLPFNFLALPPQYSDYKTSRVAILPVPYDSTTSYRSGTREAPLSIINASRFLEYFDAEIAKDSTTLGITTLPPVALETSGPETMVNKVQSMVEKLIEDKKFIVMLGGEHSLTVGAVRAFHKFFPNIGVLQIDAHLDLREEYDGSRYNHACAMRRIIDQTPVTAVGIRSVAEEEHDYLQKHNIQPFYPWVIRNKPNWIDDVVDNLPDNVYITIDADGLDPSIMPAVGTPEPDGLLWHNVTQLLQKVAEKKNIIGCDFVELSPIPGMIAPDYLASRLIYRIIGLAFQNVS